MLPAPATNRTTAILEGQGVDGQLLGDSGHALPLWRAHSPLGISLDSFSVTTH